MSIVVDFAWSKPTVAQLQSWGAVAAGMYVSPDPTKNATPAIVKACAAAGIKTFLFWEAGAQDAAQGYATGKAHATEAKAQAAALGKPGWAPVLAAVDYDLPDYAPSSTDPKAKLGPVAEYFQAWNDVIGKQQTCGYGGYWAISRLAAAGLITAGVQTVAWSGGQIDTRHIAALQNAKTLDNGNVDIELIESAALLAQLAWTPGEADPAGTAAQPAKPATVATGPREWTTAGMESLAQLAGQQGTEASTVLRMTAEHSPGQIYPANVAAWLNGVFAGTISPAAKMPAGLALYLPG